MNLTDKLTELQIYYYSLGKLHRLQSETINYLIWFFVLCNGLFTLFILEPVSCVFLLTPTLLFIASLFNHTMEKKRLLKRLKKDNESEEK